MADEAVEQVDKKGNKEGVWKIKKRLQGIHRKQLPRTLFNREGGLMSEKDELLKEVGDAISVD